MDPSKKELYVAKRSSGVDVTSKTIPETWASVRSDSSATNWMLMGYTSPNVIDVIGSGTGGLDELVQNLTEDKALFGGIRVTDNNEKIKFYFVYYIGKDLGGMAKGKASLHKNTINAQLDGLHGEICLTSDDSLDIVLENARTALEKLL